MKTILMFALVLGSFSAKAEEIVTRTIETGNEKIIAVGQCEGTTEDPNLNTLSTKFSYTVCLEKKTFKAKKIKKEGGLWNKTSYEPIPGTEVLSYDISMKSNGDTRQSTGDILTNLESAAACRSLRNMMAKAVVDLRDTGCAK